MRGSIEMNTLKQIASRAIVFVLALSVLVPAVVIAGDNNVVQAEKLATLYLTNKGTGKTTEASPPNTRTAPATRTNASTVYVTMADVDTANAVKNSHIINANKVVILSHFGRPEGKINKDLSLKKLLGYLQDTLDLDIKFLEIAKKTQSAHHLFVIKVKEHMKQKIIKFLHKN